MQQSRSYKATPCPYKPLFCQEGWCEGCKVYQEYQGQHQTSNPYPKTLKGEASGSGVEVPDIRHQLWEEGHKAGLRELVEFIENNALRATYIADPSKECWGISDYELRKLKEWGIEL